MARAKKTARGKARREPLTRDRALRAAMKLADEVGLDELSMRRLAGVLGVEAMSLYHHVPNKEAIKDGMVDLVFDEIELPPRGVDWRTAIRRRMTSMREVLLRHRWALRILESRRTPGISTLAHHDAVLGCLREAGFSIVLAAHAYAVLDSYVFGFVHTELTLPLQGDERTTDLAKEILGGIPDGAFPHLVELATTQVLVPGYSFGSEFPYGLELILDGLERARASEA